jgi:hypothetical protein
MKTQQCDERGSEERSLKLLRAGIIYLVPHSEWVSPVQVVPKKVGMTVVWTSLGPLPRWVPGLTTRWAPGTTRLVPHGT